MIDHPRTRISRPDDPRIAAYLNLKDGDLRRDMTFMAEGHLVLTRILEVAPELLESVLLIESRVEALLPALAPLPPDRPVYEVERALMDEIAGFPVHRGVLAVGSRPADRTLDAVVTGAPLLVLQGVNNTDNIGALFRNASAFGAGILLDRTCADPLYRRAIRVSMGSCFVVPHTRVEALEPVVASLEARGYAVLSLTPDVGAPLLSEVMDSRPTALLLGTEGDGLTPEILSLTQPARIPMFLGTDSLNVATAGAVALYELRRRGS